MKEGSKHFFFEKKKQKTFKHWSRTYDFGTAQRMKVFLVLFFQKKNCLLA